MKPRRVSPSGWVSPRYEVTGMSTPVLCRRCGKVYDLGKVTVTARYADCSVWTTPCCQTTADDRLWTGLPAITYLTKDGEIDDERYR